MREGKMNRPDGVEVYYRIWDDVENPIACLQIAHGMLEHVERYSKFSRFLNQHGIIVYGNDHRGHGKTAGSKEKLGSLGQRHAWGSLVEDMRVLTRTIRRENRNLPTFLFGHSMGSFLARTYILDLPEGLDGVILCGTGGNPGLKGKLGLTYVRHLIKKNGWDSINKKINHMVFGSYNKVFKNARTKMDWLNRDEKEVDQYIEDPYCGGLANNGFYEDLLGSVILVNQIETAKKVPKNLPMFFISGQEDPVGEMGNGVKKAMKVYKDANIKDVQGKLYPKARHELLLEVNHEEIYKDIFSFIQKHIA